jgi:hypothetical protein
MDDFLGLVLGLGIGVGIGVLIGIMFFNQHNNSYHSNYHNKEIITWTDWRGRKRSIEIHRTAGWQR